jgi:hypothetical protein
VALLDRSIKQRREARAVVKRTAPAAIPAMQSTALLAMRRDKTPAVNGKGTRLPNQADKHTYNGA